MADITIERNFVLIIGDLKVSRDSSGKVTHECENAVMTRDIAEGSMVLNRTLMDGSLYYGQFNTDMFEVSLYNSKEYLKNGKYVRLYNSNLDTIPLIENEENILFTGFIDSVTSDSTYDDTTKIVCYDQSVKWKDVRCWQWWNTFLQDATKMKSYYEIDNTLGYQKTSYYSLLYPYYTTVKTLVDAFLQELRDKFDVIVDLPNDSVLYSTYEDYNLLKDAKIVDATRTYNNVYSATSRTLATSTLRDAIPEDVTYGSMLGYICEMLCVIPTYNEIGDLTVADIIDGQGTVNWSDQVRWRAGSIENLYPDPQEDVGDSTYDGGFEVEGTTQSVTYPEIVGYKVFNMNGDEIKEYTDGDTGMIYDFKNPFISKLQRKAKYNAKRLITPENKKTYDYQYDMPYDWMGDVPRIPYERRLKLLGAVTNVQSKLICSKLFMPIGQRLDFMFSDIDDDLFVDRHAYNLRSEYSGPALVEQTIICNISNTGASDNAITGSSSSTSGSVTEAIVGELNDNYYDKAEVDNKLGDKLDKVGDETLEKEFKLKVSRSSGALHINQNGYYSHNGEPAISSNIVSSDKIDCNGFDIVKFYNNEYSLRNAFSIIIFFDADDNYVSGDYEKQDFSVEPYTMTVPYNAKKVVVEIQSGTPVTPSDISGWVVKINDEEISGETSSAYFVNDGKDVKSSNLLLDKSGEVASGNKYAVDGDTVYNVIQALPEPMIFKGSLGVDGTIQTLPTASKENEGYTYKVITDGTYAGKSAKAGDTFISDGAEWVLIPSGDEPSGTVTSVAIKMNNSVKGIVTTSGTIDLGTVLTGGSQTTTSDEDGGANIYTFSDGSTITVKNGNKGSKGDQGVKGDKGDTGSVASMNVTGTGNAVTDIVLNADNSVTATKGTSFMPIGGTTGDVTFKQLKMMSMGTSNAFGYLQYAGSTLGRSWTLPDDNGTIALTKNIPTVPKNVSAFTNDAGYMSKSDLSIGGTNLLFKTNKGKTNWVMSNYNGEYSLTDVDWLGTNAVSVSCTTKSTSWSVLFFNIAKDSLDKLEQGETYILSFDTDGLADTSSANISFYGIRHSDCTGELCKTVTIITSKDTSYGKHYEYKLVLKDDLSARSNKILYFANRLNGGESIKITNLKLEKGTVSSYWSNAPEDIPTKASQLTNDSGYMTIDNLYYKSGDSYVITGSRPFNGLITTNSKMIYIDVVLPKFIDNVQVDSIIMSASIRTHEGYLESTSNISITGTTATNYKAIPYLYNGTGNAIRVALSKNDNTAWYKAGTTTASANNIPVSIWSTMNVTFKAKS